jgi:hypothetical protein
MWTSLKRVLCVLLLAGGAGFAPGAFAATLGDRVSLQYFYPDLDTPTRSYAAQLVDGDGALFLNVAGVFDLTVTSTQVIASNFNTEAYWLPGAFNGFVLTNLDHSWEPFASLSRQTNMAGFTPANVSISGNAAYVNWQGLSFDQDTQVVLYLSAVPEPAAYAMLLAGGAVLLLARRRSRAQP